jgi:hypothetical protein
MYDGFEPNGRQARNIQEWLLAILRFAVTLQPADRQTVFAIAQEMDGLGYLPGRSSFSYFGRTSSDLCRAMTDRDDPGRSAVMRRHLVAIGDHRLRRATAAAMDLDGAQQARLSEARLAGSNGRSKALAQGSQRLEAT